MDFGALSESRTPRRGAGWAAPVLGPLRPPRQGGLAQTLTFKRLRSPVGTLFRQGFGARILSGGMSFHKNQLDTASRLQRWLPA